MIWHIFKKDWKLLWPLVVGVALLHFASATVLFKLGRFGEDRTLIPLLNMLYIIAILGSGFLIAALVHQDAIPGVRQDWLVRPVKRLDLLMAKLLFLLTAVTTPILMADLMEALADGFPLRQSLTAAISRSVCLLFFLGLPMLAFTSLTKNFMETIVAVVAVFFIGAAFMGSVRSPNYFLVLNSGIGWVAQSAWLAILCVGVAAMLGLQYFRRKTMSAIWVAATVELLFLFAGFMPWQAAFAVQQRRAPSPGAGGPVSIAFDPKADKLRRTEKISSNDMYRTHRLIGGSLFVQLPLRVEGVPDDSILKADLSEALIIGPDGKAQRLGVGNDLEIRNEGHGNGEKRVHHGIHIREDLYHRYKDQPIRLEIDYSMTLFQLTASHALPALGGDERMPNIGWCATKVNDAGTSVNVRCLEPGWAPTCASAFLEHVPSGRRNSARSACRPNYAPFAPWDEADAMMRFGVGLPFHDASGLAQYPVDGSQLADSRVVLRIYQPVDHFTRRLVIPEIRLTDWESAWNML
jgi:hypothetical protein